MLYIVDLVAFGLSGLFTESSSDGFMVDTSPPSIMALPTTSSSFGSAVNATHVFRTTLRAQWEFKDDQSLIGRQYISISSNVGEEFEPAAIEVRLKCIHRGSSSCINVFRYQIPMLCDFVRFANFKGL